MINLTDIVKEIQVRPPLSKQEVIDNLFDFDPNLLIDVAFYKTLFDFKKEGGYENFDLEDLLMDYYGLTGKDIDKVAKLIEDYYRTILPGDVKVIQYTNSKIDISGYKNAITKYVDDTDECYYTILTKF